MVNDIENYLDTSEGMTQIATMQDDNTISCVGASWFKYNGISCDTIYISGNSWIGFGASSEHMKIDRRDAKCHYLYRQELIYNMWKCIKFRWEGYSYYNQTTDAYKLVWELFVFETGDFFLNIINNSGKGVNSFDTLGGSGQFNPITGAQISGYCGDTDNGKSFELKEEIYNHAPPVVFKYIIENEGNYFVEENGILVKLDITELSSENFKSFGMDSIPSKSILAAFKAFKLHRWQDPENYRLNPMVAHIKAVPHNQLIVQNYDVDYSHESIESINNVRINSIKADDANVRYAISMDSGVIWFQYNGTDWNELNVQDKDEFLLNGMTQTVVESITNEEWIQFTSKFKTKTIRFAIVANQETVAEVSISDIIVNYVNVKEAA